MKVVVVSPTYNEIENVAELISQVHNITPESDILIVDDNSPDGTHKLVRELMKTDPQLHLIVRAGKMGLGTAYCEGFKWALKNGYDRVIQIDADLSHNPVEIPVMLEESKTFDVIIGSRYIKGVNVANWPLRRLMLSYFANIYSRIITGLPVKDSTGGFKCFNSKVLEAIELDKIKSEGYAFQIEMNYLSWIKKFKIKEIPIVFVDRTVGKSKMSKKIIYEAIWMVPKLKLKRILGLI